jgi:transposase InsO family protein
MELVEQAVMEGAGRSKACRLLGISVRTYERWKRQPEKPDGRQGPLTRPTNSLSDQERRRVLAVANSARFCDLSPTQIVPILADDNIYLASESTFYRILAQEKLLTHRGRAQVRRHRRPRCYVATGPNQVWCWDITYLRSSVRGRFYYLYLVLDIWSRKIVAWEVHEEENSDLATRLVLSACLLQGVDPEQLVIHSDNGGPMKGATMLATLQWLGIIPSFSRPHVCEDNAFAESIFRTLKYRPAYPTRPFASLQAAQAWVSNFVNWYNLEHRHSAIRYVTPAQRHAGEDVAILARRKALYERTRRNHPTRWTRTTRAWEPIKTVELNPERGEISNVAQTEVGAQAQANEHD